MLFREMTQSDVEYMKEHSASRGIFSKMPQQIEFSFCLEHEGKVLGIGGIQLINLTTAWGYIDLSTNAKEHIITVYRTVKEWTDILVKDKGIKRLQCYIEADFEEAIRLVKHLGLHYEFTMPKFVGNKPACMFVRFFDGE